MPRSSPRRLLASVRRIVHTDPSSVAPTEVLPVIDERMVPRVLDLSTRIGEAMFAVGASAHEVTLAITRVCDTYGLRGVQVDVTYNSITVSFHLSGEVWPETLLRVVRVTAPDHAKLQRVQALVADIQGGLDLETARLTFRAIRRVPFRYQQPVVVTARAMLAVGVSIMLGASPIIVGLTFVAALGAALTQAGLARLRVPLFFSQIAGGFVTTAVAVAVSALGAAGIDVFVGIRPSIIVASGIVLMLAGLTVVGAAQDAIDGFALTAGGRILDLTMQTLGVVVGILVGLELGSVLGFTMDLSAEPIPFGSLPGVFAGAIIIAIAVAVFNGAGIRIILVSALLSTITMAGYTVATALQLHPAAASAIGALLASFVGVLIAYHLHVPSVAVTTAAIVPLVPGVAVFQGLLEMINNDGSTSDMLTGSTSLILAAVVGIALASGASLGLYLGTPVRSTLESVTKTRARVRR
ncbi:MULTISPECIES: threonine/serine exporter ThrE family protein [unclassified Microbacterium]|uniref:threonine/serine ThrE exporter family protein n=1 Tax=unclassified Microbacterium TaxID=2609290 RepID=UPI000EA9DE43|nr:MULTISPECIES: threonine/serine exporter family protein [unclassified Microbacterium]MBT2484644.1 threonine/serine exporter family protein [Microbacterium sp. ISL-108]RKN67534.1 threonine/serine exporter family protein [Microbacterium sp. CGR2]